MWPYLKAAFWARPAVPALGRVPLNALLLGGLGLLGVGHPGFWLAGAAAEAAYLYALTANPRFQRLVDAQASGEQTLSAEKQRLALVGTLMPPRRQRLARLEEKCDRVLSLQADGETDPVIVEGNREALLKIQWLYLKLLVAQQNIAALGNPIEDDGLPRQIAALETDLQSERISAPLKESKAATLHILRQRSTNLDRRAQTLEEIASDLTRIEAQVELAVENAGMRGQPAALSANIDLVSQLLDDSFYGESGARVAALEGTYGQKN